MGDPTTIVRGAAVQAVPVFLDREATVEKAIATADGWGGKHQERSQR